MRAKFGNQLGLPFLEIVSEFRVLSLKKIEDKYTYFFSEKIYILGHVCYTHLKEHEALSQGQFSSQNLNKI